MQSPRSSLGYARPVPGAEFEASLPFIVFGAAGVLVLFVVGWIVRGAFADRRWSEELPW